MAQSFSRERFQIAYLVYIKIKKFKGSKRKSIKVANEKPFLQFGFSRLEKRFD
jgi:hypothetical protein